MKGTCSAIYTSNERIVQLKPCMINFSQMHDPALLEQLRNMHDAEQWFGKKIYNLKYVSFIVCLRLNHQSSQGHQILHYIIARKGLFENRELGSLIQRNNYRNNSFTFAEIATQSSQHPKTISHISRNNSIVGNSFMTILTSIQLQLY